MLAALDGLGVALQAEPLLPQQVHGRDADLQVLADRVTRTGWYSESAVRHGNSHEGVHMAAVEIFFHRVLTDDRWMNQAACKGLTHLFFPPPAERPPLPPRR